MRRYVVAVLVAALGASACGSESATVATTLEPVATASQTEPAATASETESTTSEPAPPDAESEATSSEPPPDASDTTPASGADAAPELVVTEEEVAALERQLDEIDDLLRSIEDDLSSD
jgi:hypothetical protein